MALRLLAWATVLLLSFSTAGSAAVLFLGPEPEQLIEGHTVFATVNLVRNQTAEDEYAAAVAVLVRDITRTLRNSRFPGVLWFDDQYLTEPVDSRRLSQPRQRFPCTGAVIAVNRGDPVDVDPNGRWTLVNASYANESYLITDPNDHTWTIDLWNTTHGTYAWTVAIMNRDAMAHLPDDGKCSGSRYTDGARSHRSPSNGMDYPCDGCDDIAYNALLYFRLQHLRHQNVTKDHREVPGSDLDTDASGCHAASTNAWPCPDGDDDREGNSHPYNPGQPFPIASYDGRGNHGESAECDDGGRVSCHATFDIDLYFGYVTPPIVRTYWIVDAEGRNAAYHCHEDMQLCDPTIVSG